MHEDLLERRLQASLHEEADSLPLTITAAELERRVALRRRSFAGRRLTLLLAAAVAIGLFGVGGALAGLFDQTPPRPTTPVVALDPTEPAPTGLPTLHELIATEPRDVVLAQAHGPTDVFGGIPERDLDYPLVSLGTLDRLGSYTVSAACLGGPSLDFAFVPHQAGPIPSPALPCDGRVHDAEVEISEPQDATFKAVSGTSWRVVIRGATSTAPSGPIDPIPSADPDTEELLRWDATPVDPGAQTWGNDGLLVQEVGAVPGWGHYDIRAICAGSPIRVIFGGVIDGALVANTETQIPCNPMQIRDARLLIDMPGGSTVYLAAKPDQPVSLLVTSPRPPVALTEKLPGWQISGGFGPDYAFAPNPVSFGGAGDGEDHVQVVLSCTGTTPIDVVVEDGNPIGAHKQTFRATCSEDGATTSQTFKVTEHSVTVSYVPPKGAWTALSILVPDATH